MADPAWLDPWTRSRNNPLIFVTDVLGVEKPEKWQVEALRAIGEHDRISIRSGHGVGKTTLLAWLVLWFLLTRRDAKVPVTANSQDQLRDTIWPEINKWWRRLPDGLKDQLEVQAERVVVKADPEGTFAVQRTASKERPEALQGFHAEHILFLIDEASGIEEKVFEVGMGALSTAGAKAVLAGNPTKANGFFYDTHHALRGRWQTLHVNSEDVPRATGHIEDIIAKYGKQSNQYRVRVLGEFPTAEDEAVIPLEYVLSAVEREVGTLEYQPLWGLDVARFGDDRTALAKRRQNKLLEPVQSWRGHDLMRTTGRLIAEYEKTPEEDRPSEILVDVIGMGAGVVDRALEMGLPVRGVSVGEMAASKDLYRRLRDELWFRGRDWFAARNCSIPKDDALIAELTYPVYTFSSDGRLIVESKLEAKKRGKPSPDLADAFLLTFAGFSERKIANRWRRGYKQSATTGWAA
jgi:phage terminase large subunit